MLQPGKKFDPDHAVFIRYGLRRGSRWCNRLDQIGPAYDADKLAVSNDRNPFDSVSFENTGNLGQRCVFGCKYHVIGHDLGHLPTMGLGEAELARLRGRVVRLAHLAFLTIHDDPAEAAFCIPSTTGRHMLKSEFKFV